MAVISKAEYLQPLELFIQSVEIMWDERAENGSDISTHLLIDINNLLRELGQQLANLKSGQLQTLNKTFQKVTPILKKFAADTKLWAKNPTQAQRLLQTIATINNITNVYAIPSEAVLHPFFHGHALKYGLIALQELDLPPQDVPTPKTFAMNYAEDQLNKFSFPEKCAIFLLRPSSSVSSTEQAKVVTLSFKIGSGPVCHQRLYNEPGSDHRPWNSGKLRAFTLQSLILTLLSSHGAETCTGLKALNQDESKKYTTNRYVNF